MAYWTLVISVLCFVGISALSGKGYYCRDPDTGKLYPVNSTWQSSTFCGNYTCKLRKKDTAKPVVPIREKVIDLPISPTIIQAKSSEVKEEEESMQTAASTNIASSTMLNKIYPSTLTEPPNTPSTTTVSAISSDLDSSSSDKINIIDIKTATETNGDRYLTEEEIKTISNLLYSVKKSDLEAIVDIYNLAQDIYKEMDKITSQSILEETIQAARNGRGDVGKKSYWYEPLSRMNKLSVADMDVRGTNTLPTTVERSTMDPYSFFQGPLSRNDFGSLPYYYTVSDFQREHSYVNDNKQPSVSKNEKPHCTHGTPYQHPPVYEHKPALTHYSYYPPQSYGNIVNKPYPVETQKAIQPSMLLPYPFSFIQHYNMSAYPYNVYYSGKPWNTEHLEKSEQYFKAYQPQLSQNTINSKPETKPNSYKEHKEVDLSPNTESKYDKGEVRLDREDKQSGLHKNLLDTLFEQAKIEPKSKPDWQTDPLASNVLEEIKAHFEEKVKLLKPISFRKKTKLERVGKVLKLDELNKDRRRRSVDQVSKFEVGEEDFEAYVEKTTCRSDTEPGFYQMGNINEPYPACCPRKIENKTR